MKLKRIKHTWFKKGFFADIHTIFIKRVHFAFFAIYFNAIRHFKQQKSNLQQIEMQQKWTTWFQNPKCDQTFAPRLSSFGIFGTVFEKPFLTFFQASVFAMNGTANIDVTGDSLFENLHPVDEAVGSNMSIYYSIKSNDSNLADCSQTILMDEIRVRSIDYFCDKWRCFVLIGENTPKRKFS